jgi:hypothetical protein
MIVFRIETDQDRIARIRQLIGVEAQIGTVAYICVRHAGDSMAHLGRT